MRFTSEWQSVNGSPGEGVINTGSLLEDASTICTENLIRVIVQKERYAIGAVSLLGQFRGRDEVAVSLELIFLEIKSS